MIDEYHPVNLDPRAPQWIRDRVETDLMVSTRTGLSPLKITVLRFTPSLTRGMGSPLHDFLDAPVCFTPIGPDPILNVIDQRDMVRAIDKTLSNDVEGIFNIPGLDTLAMSDAIRRFGKRQFGLPGAALSRLYTARGPDSWAASSTTSSIAAGFTGTACSMAVAPATSLASSPATVSLGPWGRQHPRARRRALVATSKSDAELAAHLRNAQVGGVGRAPPLPRAIAQSVLGTSRALTTAGGDEGTAFVYLDPDAT